MSDETKGTSDSSLARMAGNIAAGIAQRFDVWPGDHGNQVFIARESVAIARRIIAEIQSAAPPEGV